MNKGRGQKGLGRCVGVLCHSCARDAVSDSMDRRALYRCSKWYPTSSDYFTVIGKEFQEQSVSGADNTEALSRILKERLAEVRHAVVTIPSGGIFQNEALCFSVPMYNTCA